MQHDSPIEVSDRIVPDHAILVQQIQNGCQHIIPIRSPFRCLEIDVQVRVLQMQIPKLAGDLHG